MNPGETESQMLEQARQQTDALRNIQSAVMLIAALVLLAAVFGLVAFVRG